MCNITVYKHLILILLSINSVVLSLIDCDNVLADNSYFVGLCNNKWSNLKPLIKPTQSQVGYAWIQYKVNKDFSSSKDAQSEIDSSPSPGVIAPDNSIYIVDDHHTLCALDYSGYTSTSVTVNIICDKRSLSSMSEFWSEMKSQNLAYLAAHPSQEPNALPVAITYSQLPTFFSFTSSLKAFTDDPWRSMAGYSRKVTTAASPAPSCSSSDSKYCERCMYRGCVDGYKATGAGVAYFEFRWAYFMNDATYFNLSIWPSTTAYNSFSKLYKDLPPSVMGKVDTDQWFATANNVISLCRGSAGATYPVPTSLYPGDGTLPGYYSGYVKLPDDPDCSSPSCK